LSVVNMGAPRPGPAFQPLPRPRRAYRVGGRSGRPARIPVKESRGIYTSVWWFAGLVDAIPHVRQSGTCRDLIATSLRWTHSERRPWAGRRCDTTSGWATKRAPSLSARPAATGPAWSDTPPAAGRAWVPGCRARTLLRPYDLSTTKSARWKALTR